MRNANSIEFRIAKVNLGSDLTVPCHLSLRDVDMEIKWFKETECICLYKNGEMAEGKSYEGRVSLLTEELKVSLRLQNFRETDLGDYVCQVTNRYSTEETTIRVTSKDTQSMYMDAAQAVVDTVKLGILGIILAVGAVLALVAAVSLTEPRAPGKDKDLPGAALMALLAAIAGFSAKECINRAQEEAATVSTLSEGNISFKKIDRTWSEQERKKMKRSDRLTETQACCADRDKKIINEFKNQLDTLKKELQDNIKQLQEEIKKLKKEHILCSPGGW